MLVLSLLSTHATSCEGTRETDVRCGYPSSLSGANEPECTNVGTTKVGAASVDECLEMCAGLAGCAGVDFIHPGHKGSGGQGLTSASTGRCFFRQSTSCGRSCSIDQAAGGRSCYTLSATGSAGSCSVHTVTPSNTDACPHEESGSESGGGGVNVGAVVGGCLGGVAVLVLVLVCAYCHLRNRVSSREPPAGTPPTTAAAPAIVLQGMPVDAAGARSAQKGVV